MSNRITFIGTIVFLLLHLFAREASGQERIDSVQNKIDSIQAEVKALKESYNEKMTALYEEMLALSQDEDNNVIEKMKAQSYFHIFPIEESVSLMVDSLHVEYFIKEEGEDVYKRPFFLSLIRLINKNGEESPAIMEKLLTSLDKPIDSYEEYFNYYLIFVNFFNSSVAESLNHDDMAACVRIIADPNSRYDSVRRKNLLKIAEILDRS